MQYLLTIIFAVAVLCVQALLIVLKLTGEFSAGWGLILLPTWFVCGVVVLGVLLWILVLFFC